MSFSLLGDINWLAVIISGVAYFALGALWYSPVVLGNQWMATMGIDAEDGPPEMSPATYLGPLLAYIVAAIAIAMVAEASSTDTFGEAVVLGLVLGIGLAEVLFFVTALFDPQKNDPMRWFAITAGYHVLGILITSVIVAIA